MLIRNLKSSLGIGLILFCILTLYYLSNDLPNRSGVLRFGSRHPACTVNASYFINDLNVSRVFEYSRREIRTIRTKSVERALTTNISEGLFPKSQTLRYDGYNQTILLDPLRTACGKPLTLQVPHTPKKVDASRIMFGMATKIERIPASLPQLMHWLPHSGASLLIVMPETQLPSTIHEMEYYLRAYGIDATIVTSSAQYENQYLSLYERLLLKSKARQKPADWFAFIDDDTFIPSLSNLITHLDKRYDPKLPWFISSLSEDFNQVRKHGYIGYGGSGVFLSRPLVESLHKHYAACATKLVGDQGDHMLTHCINKYTSTRLTIDYDLHQLDFRGDVSGFFQSGRLPLTIHHWRSWFSLDVAKMALVSRVAGDNSILQRWRFHPYPNANGSHMVLSNGYSIVVYGRNVTMPSEEHVEWTWRANGEQNEMWQWEHAVGPLVEQKIEGKEKETFLMVDAKLNEKDGSVRQIYYRNGTKEKLRDRVLELVWLP